MPTSSDIRRQFIDYFVQKRDHRFVPSSPVVPHNDPTLLFTNAGMNQFKPYFLGTEKPDHPRAANTQKCIRAGGKHNDLEDVGKDTYHHTFFEMLGNWSFGDYFKDEAIDWAWDLLVNVWGLDADRLHATYFEGDAAEGLEPDHEARELWSKYLPTERIHPGNKKDNFWEMGDTGPCGPCSEIHYDGTPDRTGGPLVNKDHPDVIEIWNLVFIQFNRAPGSPGSSGTPGSGGGSGKLSPLPAKHVDTGMGFERIVRVLQGKSSNYDTDVFTPIFAAIQKVTGARAYDGGSGTLNDPIDIAYRVIADHIRCLTFALADGAHCGNEGRDYVLRRILRRAVRYGRQTLDCHEPFFHKLVPAVIEQMGDFFPELKKKQDDVVAELREEEASFGKTLDRGIALFEAACGLAQGQITAADAFQLHDTYGFPLDLTQLMAEERGMTVDVEGFNKLMEEARQRSRGEGGGVDLRGQLTELVQQHDLPATQFLGYDTTQDTRQQTVRVFELPENQAALVLQATPFYAEAGGQVGDVGVITINDATFNVHDTIKVGDTYFHLGRFEEKIVDDNITATVTAQVNDQRRARIMSNHTCTHLLNRALRVKVNPEADQKGSLVDDQKLRFDFSNQKAVDITQLEQVERMVNDDITADMPVYAGIAPQEEALKINGLRAVFGEKYPPKVRVVAIGVKPEELLNDPANEAWKDYSIEFCGGTHLQSTGEAEGFVIISEEAVAKGIRRITALTGAAAHEVQARADALLHRMDAIRQAASRDQKQLLEHLPELTNAMNEATLPALARHRLQAGIADMQDMIKQLQKEQSRQAAGQVVDVARELADRQGGPVIVCEVPNADANSLRTAMDVIRSKHPDAALFLGAATDGKVALLASVPAPMIEKGLKAGDWIRDIAKIVGGGGGGRPDMAQAGGKNPEKLAEALEAAKAFAAQKTG